MGLARTCAACPTTPCRRRRPPHSTQPSETAAASFIGPLVEFCLDMRACALDPAQASPAPQRREMPRCAGERPAASGDAPYQENRPG